MGKGGDDLRILLIAHGGSSSPGLCTSRTDAAGAPYSGRKRPGHRVSLKDAERSRTRESHFERMCIVFLSTTSVRLKLEISFSIWLDSLEIWFWRRSIRNSKVQISNHNGPTAGVCQKFV